MELKSIYNVEFPESAGQIKRQMRKSTQTISVWYHVGFFLLCRFVLAAPWQPQHWLADVSHCAQRRSCYVGYWFFTCLPGSFMVCISRGFSGAGSSCMLTFHLVLDDFEGQHVERDRDDCDKTLRGSETEPVLSSPNSFIKHVMKLLIFIDSVPFLYKKKS